MAIVPTERLSEKVHSGTTRFESYPHSFRVLPLDDWQPGWNRESGCWKRRDEIECRLYLEIGERRIYECRPWITFATFAHLGHTLSSPLSRRASTAVRRLQTFAYSRRKPSPQRLIWPTEGDGKCMVQHNVSVSQ